MRIIKIENKVGINSSFKPENLKSKSYVEIPPLNNEIRETRLEVEKIDI